MDTQKLADNLRAARKAKNMTLKELADKSGVATATIHHAETAKTDITAIRLYRIAQALKISINKLFQ